MKSCLSRLVVLLSIIDYKLWSVSTSVFKKTFTSKNDDTVGSQYGSTTEAARSDVRPAWILTMRIAKACQALVFQSNGKRAFLTVQRINCNT